MVARTKKKSRSLLASKEMGVRRLNTTRLFRFTENHFHHSFRQSFCFSFFPFVLYWTSEIMLSLQIVANTSAKQRQIYKRKLEHEISIVDQNIIGYNFCFCNISIGLRLREMVKEKRKILFRGFPFDSNQYCQRLLFHQFVIFVFQTDLESYSHEKY